MLLGAHHPRGQRMEQVDGDAAVTPVPLAITAMPGLEGSEHRHGHGGLMSGRAALYGSCVCLAWRSMTKRAPDHQSAGAGDRHEEDCVVLLPGFGFRPRATDDLRPATLGAQLAVAWLTDGSSPIVLMGLAASCLIVTTRPTWSQVESQCSCSWVP